MHPLREQQPIGQTRQDIAVCKLLNAFLGRVLQRQVAHEADALHHPTFIVAQRNPRKMHGAVRTVVTGQPKLALPEALTIPSGQHLFHEGCVRTTTKQGRRQASLKRCRARPNQTLAARIHAHELVLAICNEDGVQAGIKNPCRQTQASLHLGLAGDVPKGIHTSHGSSLVKLGHNAALHRHAAVQLQDVGALQQRLTFNGGKARLIVLYIHHHG